MKFSMMRAHLAVVLALLAAGCGPFSHNDTDAQWLFPDSGRASVALRPADRSRPLRIAVYGDVHRGREAHRAVVAAIRREKPDLVVFTGDAIDCRPLGHMPDFGAVSYAIPLWPQFYRGRPLFGLLSLVPFPAAVHELVISGAWPIRHANGLNDFLEDTAPLRLEDRTPFLFVPGNHDVFHDFDRREIARIFGQPGGDAGRDPFALWYSADIGNVRFVVMDTGSDTPGDFEPLAEGGAQMKFLRATLADAEERGMSAIVCAHLPPWASGDEDPPREAVEEQLGEAVLARPCVSLVLSGHTHRYERIVRARSAGDPATFLVTACGGAPPAEESADPMAGSQALIEHRHHFVLLEIGADAIKGKFVDVPVLGDDEPGKAASYLPAPPPADEFTIPLPHRASR